MCVTNGFTNVNNTQMHETFVKKGKSVKRSKLLKYLIDYVVLFVVSLNWQFASLRSINLAL